MDVLGVLCVMLVASLAPAWGEVVVIEEVLNNDLERSCPHEGIPNTQFDVPYAMLNAQHECYKPSATFLTQLNFASTTDEFRRLFQQHCVQAPQARTCIADVARDADVCLTALQRKMFATVQHFAEVGLEATCEDRSETVARIYGDELKTLDFFSQMRVLGCVTACAVKSEYRREADLPAYTLRRYEAIKEAKECVGKVAHAKKKSATHFDGFVEHMLSGMQCISPSTQEVVLCSSLEAQANSSESLEN